jgi:hypothetical protein
VLETREDGWCEAASLQGRVGFLPLSYLTPSTAGTERVSAWTESYQ